jgi:hypothetical protein
MKIKHSQIYKFLKSCLDTIKSARMHEIKLKNIVYNIYRKIKLDSKFCTVWFFVEIIEV